ncbi:MAG: lipid II flippase MurJ [Acidimicrobiales bacterium]
MSVDARHSTRVASMAAGTLVSRLTGLVRVFVLAWVLGFTPIADAFNLANTVPNMLFDVVLGGVATATFIPVFVESLARDGERRAWRSISSIATLAAAVLVVASVLAWVFAPLIIDGFTFVSRHSSAASSATTEAVVAAQRAVATTLLRWFVPQIFFYGLIALATSLLNVRRRFAIAAWVPIANNVVAIAALVWYHLVDPTPVLEGLSGTRDLAWLGALTTAGVAVQFLLLVPSLARSDLWRMRLRFDLRDHAVRTVARLSGWTLGLVAANQASLYVVLALAFGIGGDGPVSAYTYGWSFMMMPYAVVVVSVMSSLAPQLARLSTEDRPEAFAERLRFGLRQSLVIILPATAAFIVLSQPLAAILLNRADARAPLLAGTAIAVLAAGLPGFCVFQLCVRGLQAMQRAREVFLLYVLDNGVAIALCVAIGRHSLAGLCAAVSIGYTVAALAALGTLALHRVDIIAAVGGVHVRRSLVATVVAALVMAVVYAAPSWSHGLRLVVRFGAAGLAGTLGYLLIATVGARRARRAAGPRARL